MEVLKFGGTSVGSPERMRQIATLITGGEKKIVVLSAVSGTTNTLVEICQSLYKKDQDRALELIDGLEERYREFISELVTESREGEEVLELVLAMINGIRSFTRKQINLFIERSILAQGELISTHIFYYYLKSIGVKAVLLPALDFMRVDDKDEPDSRFIEENLEFEVSKYPGKELFITQGYICRNAYGEISNLKRGGSDYTASLIGSAIRANSIQIWTDIDGMHNNDPRVVEQTMPISELSFEEAAELAYFGAKILHPASIRPAKEQNVPVWLKNTMKPEAHGTLIHSKTSQSGFKAVAAKDGITAIKIRSGRMLMAYGFLRTVFEIFERYKTPIDMITTSEVAVSVTIDDDTHLAEIVRELEEISNVEVDSDQTIVCVVGDFVHGGHGYAARIFEALNSIPIRMISYGGSSHNISVLVKSEFKQEALQQLNTHLFNL
ncbi:aspartate kinase [bacterium SCSIO 12741]|nr:aspartate kinase [bacterium SCSIO 12741]